MMRASALGVLRENIDWLASVLAEYRKGWNKRISERYLQVVLSGEETQGLIDDLLATLAEVEQEPS